LWYPEIMRKSIRDTTKKRGRPKTTGRGEAVMVRLHNPLLAAIDAWCAAQSDMPSRSEALRRFADQALAAEPAPAPRKPKGKTT
jgi:hypothetical protein